MKERARLKQPKHQDATVKDYDISHQQVSVDHVNHKAQDFNTSITQDHVNPVDQTTDEKDHKDSNTTNLSATAKPTPPITHDDIAEEDENSTQSNDDTDTSHDSSIVD